MGKFSFLGLVYDQYTRVPPVLTADLTGKSVMVTGANTGLGLETAKHFARMNPARLILACRNVQKAQDAAAIIAKDTSYRAEVQAVDFSQFDSVVALANRLEDDPLDIIVANAAVAQGEYRTSTDGWEETLQVNHLSTALLSFLLLPNLLRAAELHNSTSRLVIVTSEMSFVGQFSDAVLSQPHVLAALSSKEVCTPAVMANRYPLSKLLNILFTRAFTQHLAPSAAAAVVPTSANPGFCHSELTRNVSGLQQIRFTLMKLALARTSEQGARQFVWAALGPDGKDGPHVRHTMAGAYVSLAEVREPSDFTISREGYEVQERLWVETIDILKKAAPAVQSIVDKYFSG